MSFVLIHDVQRSLQSAGYSPGPIDGVLGSQTMVAVMRFQRVKGLSTGSRFQWAAFISPRALHFWNS